MDLDTLSPRRLDDFDYAITTRAAYQSTAPPNFEPVVRTALVRALAALGADAPAAGHRRGRHARAACWTAPAAEGAGWPSARAPRP